MTEVNHYRLNLMIESWKRLNDEVLQSMRMLDYWLMFLIVLLLALIYISRQESYKDAIVLAAIVGAITPVWVGRLDVLIHRPVPATIAVEHEINDYLEWADNSTAQDRDYTGYRFKTWENTYKPMLKTGVKVLAPLDALVLVFLLVLFAYANNQAYLYLASSHWSQVFWAVTWIVFVTGVGIIAFARQLAQ